MAVDLVVPSVGESITEVQIGRWLKGEGESVSEDEPVVELESDKATLDLPAPAAGTVVKILKQSGETAKIGEVIGSLEPGATAPVKKPVSKPAEAEKPAEAKAVKKETPAPKPDSGNGGSPAPKTKDEPLIMPAAARALEAAGLSPDEVEGTGPGGRILKEDALKAIQAAETEKGQTEIQAASEEPPTPAKVSEAPYRQEDIVPMSPMRARIAERLVEAQQTAALLTTFNEIDMSHLMQLRKDQQESFQKRHGVKLGFMSFFVKAVIDALKQFPAVNAEIRGNQIVYRNYYDIGIAVGGGKGLVVPILRNAERMSFADIEKAIADFAERARNNRIEIAELKGGTFSISNGGIYGSLLSTPIVNPPQSGILGMHAIQDRPVAVDGQVVIRPMMYIALTYDHRLVDGREAVSFLKRIKECIEDPSRMLLEV